MTDVMHYTTFSCCNICEHWQYLFPWHGRKYAKSEKTLRAVGRNCIEQRIKALENKEDVPQDILMRMLGLLRKYCWYTMSLKLCGYIPSAILLSTFFDAFIYVYMHAFDVVIA